MRVQFLQHTRDSEIGLPSLEDVPEQMLRRMTDYIAACARLTNGEHDFRIPPIVATRWITQGECVVSPKGHAREFGTSRGTMSMALNRLSKAGSIRHVGRTRCGRVLEPVLEVGDRWRASRGR